ncbi:MAG TPA: 2-hydroxyhepta-2,4-diene-1,7-dioate isomerase, partial [Hyphomicrobiaceae bacterium]|nr:2-hydroxyhepta-2,4-diene-1,7-dioate isomerase [Hyphomicrobiaceae bacterium]
MKLVRFGQTGSEKPGILDADGAIRDLSAHISDLDGSALTPESLAKLRAVDVSSLPKAPADARLSAPVANVRSFIAVGLNYADHAAETGSPIPPEPIL